MHEASIEKTTNLLIKFFKLRLKDIDQVAVAFSGSLDSALVAFMVSKYTNTTPVLYTIGFPDSYDIKISKSTIDQLNNLDQKGVDGIDGINGNNQLNQLHHLNQISHKILKLDEDSVKESLAEYLHLTNDTDKISISFSLPFFMLLSNIEEKHVLTGHGADTLFGGFHKYLQSSDLKKDIAANYTGFLGMLPKRELLMAEHYNKKLVLPFTDTELSNYVLSLPEDIFIKESKRKWLLKQVARQVGVPIDVINLPKKAFQYSTGIDKYLKQLRKEKG